MQKSCIIIPCYNEAARLNLDAFHRFCTAEKNVDFCFVDDGSTDGTNALLEGFVTGHRERSRLIVIGSNRGKAEAVRRGVLESLENGPFDLIGYFDADLSTPLSAINGFTSVFNRKKRCRFVMGSRFRHMGVRIVRTTVRHYLGRIFSTFSSMLLDLPVYDTQCGAKLLRADTARTLFSEPFVGRWLFDVELLARMIVRYGRLTTLGSVVEFPLREWDERKGSRLRWHYAIAVPFELMKIRKRYFPTNKK
ncbi:MAG: glycosyltransferase [Chitinispirillaceae bacterium]|nr:glycosyltransferase [Chitinispirillaceae bacterium]